MLAKNWIKRSPEKNQSNCGNLDRSQYEVVRRWEDKESKLRRRRMLQSEIERKQNGYEVRYRRGKNRGGCRHDDEEGAVRRAAAD